MSMTIWGDVIISFILTLFADGLGRRRTLMLGSLLMTASGVAFMLSGNYWVLVLASVLGVISPNGNEIGPFKAIEESTLSQLSPPTIRSDIFAWYTLLGNAGTACGVIICGWLVEGLQALDGWTPIRAYRVIFGIYALLGMIKFVLSLMLSDKCEPEPEKLEHQELTDLHDVEIESLLSSEDEGNPSKSRQKGESKAAPPLPEQRRSIWPSISPASRSILLKLCILFAFDSLGSGLVPASWITYFFTTKFSLPEGTIGTLFFITSIIAALSNFVASSISKRIGLLKTMVFTHLPSAIFLALIPLLNNAFVAMTFLVLRSCTQNMDQAPRQAFLAAAVLPSERTAVMGVVNVARGLSASGGPVLTGWLAGMKKFWVAFLVAGALKGGYDLAMLKLFLGYKSREEVDAGERMERRTSET